MIIRGIDIYKMKLIENMIEPKLQIQPAGVELTLKEVETIEDTGSIDLTNKNRKIPKTKRLKFDKEGKIRLKKGTYKIRYNEIVKIPQQMIAIAYPRSSLIRSGATIFTAIWDPGYVGRSESLLLVLNDKGITLEKNARLIQLIYIKLEKEPHRTYDGRYQKENIR